MVEYIKIKETYVSYPVGKNMINAKATGLEYIKAIKKVFLDRKNVKHSLEGVNLIGTGSSGAILCTIVFLGINEFFVRVNVIHVKKSGESSHSSNSSINTSGYINIFIDDFVSTGETIERVYKELKSKTLFEDFDMICISNDYKKINNTHPCHKFSSNTYEILNKTKFVTYKGRKSK